MPYFQDKILSCNRYYHNVEITYGHPSEFFGGWICG